VEFVAVRVNERGEKWQDPQHRNERGDPGPSTPMVDKDFNNPAPQIGGQDGEPRGETAVGVSPEEEDGHEPEQPPQAPRGPGAIARSLFTVEGVLPAGKGPFE